MGAHASTDHKRKPNFTFIWAIENGSELPVNGYVESPRFIVPFMEETLWKIVNKLLFNRAMEIAIQREDNGPNSIQIEFEFSVLGHDGYPLRTKTSKKEFKSKEEVSLKLFEDYDEVFAKRKAEFLPNNELTIRCRMWQIEADLLKTDTCLARTRLGVDRRCFVLAIRDFSSLRLKQKTTPFLNSATNGSAQLILNVFLSKNIDKYYVNIQIEQNAATRDHIFICKISLLDSDYRSVHSVTFCSFIQVNSPEVFTCREFFEKDLLLKDENLLPNDVLSLRCEFQIDADLLWNRIETYRYLSSKDLERIKTEMPDIKLGDPDEPSKTCCPFKKAFENLYKNDSFSDVSIHVGTKTFPAHKTVLSSRSSVFKDMFTLDIGEKSRKIVDITDMSYDTFDRLLLYIYKDTVPDLQWEGAMDLFKAADKHQLSDLRNKCSFFLKSNISVNNVCSILPLTYMHEDNNLRLAVESFISEHDREVFNSETWKEFTSKNVSLALEITERVIYSINRKNYFASFSS